MSNELKLAELLCTRLCHDLAGPIGAVNNGAELLDEDESTAKQAFALIQMSAKNAVNKLMFFRNAYGRINFSGEADLYDLKSLAEAYLEGGKVTVEWEGLDNAEISVSRRMGRLMLLLVLVSSESLVRGGVVKINLYAGAFGTGISALASGSNIKFDDSDKSVLSGVYNLDEIEPKKAPMVLVSQTVDSLNAGLECRATDNELIINVTRGA